MSKIIIEHRRPTYALRRAHIHELFKHHQLFLSSQDRLGTCQLSFASHRVPAPLSLRTLRVRVEKLVLQSASRLGPFGVG
ncbi:MAG: hypothetical protein SGI77_06295 [Pirellulaceae bacterium]|nr:hypothetical protein [Pirellulaceae bacterium]